MKSKALKVKYVLMVSHKCIAISAILKFVLSRKTIITMYLKSQSVHENERKKSNVIPDYGVYMEPLNIKFY